MEGSVPTHAENEWGIECVGNSDGAQAIGGAATAAAPSLPSSLSSPPPPHLYYQQPPAAAPAAGAGRAASDGEPTVVVDIDLSLDDLSAMLRAAQGL